MISIPIAVRTPLFQWQLDLFWFNHKLTYGEFAPDRARAAVVTRNTPNEYFSEWSTEAPHQVVRPFFERLAMGYNRLAQPLNIQCALAQMLPSFDDEEVIEVLDCDMFHIKPSPVIHVQDEELYVCTEYENWHLHSTTHSRYVVAPYLTSTWKFNGGFVPIIGKVKTFRKILDDWTRIHWGILNRSELGELVHWWAGMYALQAACSLHEINMISMNTCYLPGYNALMPNHYIAHYSVDPFFDKKTFPNVNLKDAPDNVYYQRIRAWMAQS